MKPQGESCESCRYWMMSQSDLGKGNCVRRAPALIWADPTRQIFGWPLSQRQQWCGEYAPEAEATPLARAS
jgi:hypothetical protein